MHFRGRTHIFSNYNLACLFERSNYSQLKCHVSKTQFHLFAVADFLNRVLAEPKVRFWPTRVAFYPIQGQNKQPIKETIFTKYSVIFLKGFYGVWAQNNWIGWLESMECSIRGVCREFGGLPLRGRGFFINTRIHQQFSHQSISMLIYFN